MLCESVLLYHNCIIRSADVTAQWYYF